MCHLNWLRNWLPPILWTLQIFYFSSLPRGSYPKIDEQHFDTGYLQYLYHFGQFFCLSLLIYRAILRSAVAAKMATTRHSHMVKHALLAIAIIAFVDELIQIPVPTRKFTVRDLMADVAGGGFGLLIVQMSKRSKDVNGVELDTGGRLDERDESKANRSAVL
jgi:hypothetical protein